jgi:hypothetical protein
MNTFSKPTATALLAVALLSTVWSANAYAANDAPTKFISGGASVEEFTALNQQAAGYSLKLVFAAKGSGAYLADVDVSVMELPSRAVVLETRTQGPLLLAELPAGRYEVSAKYAGVYPGSATTITRTITVSRAGRVSQVMYFNTADLVGAESPREFHTGR